MKHKNQNEIKVKAAQLIAQQLKLDTEATVDWGQTLEQLGLDSLDCVELVIRLEDAFRVEISDQVAMQWRRLDDIVQFIDDGMQTRFKATGEQHGSIHPTT